jgi:hypothetical protein
MTDNNRVKVDPNKPTIGATQNNCCWIIYFNENRPVGILRINHELRHR